ncbi:MAG: hypothetical protein DWQ05_17125 [Calditrichaeota bacterium]|nr:MAG: hypothetical protein DWQ05_17125 [Calditrichota bacterium]
MKKFKTVLNSLAVFFLLSTPFYAQSPPEQQAIISVERIWDKAQHSAFTSLVYFNEQFFCAFREGSAHVPGINGTIRIITSEDGQNWRSVAHLSKKDIDLRDPMLSITPHNRLMLNCGGSHYEGKKLLGMQPLVSFSDQKGANFSQPAAINIDKNIRSGKDWLWRATWHKGLAYAAVYQAGQAKLQLVQSGDGKNYKYISTLNVPGFPNETTLRFSGNGELTALVRRDSQQPTGFLGSSAYPYKNWQWNELNIRLGGPDLLRFENGKMICGTRDYQPNSKRKMMLGKITRTGFFTKLLNLPSDGDCSYPGLLVVDDILYISYYSSHEEKTAIYFAQLRMDYINSWLQKDTTAPPKINSTTPGIIELSSNDSAAMIRYTLDGQMPDQDFGSIYNQPIRISKTTTLRAVAHQKGKLPSQVVSTEIGTDLFQNAVAGLKIPKPGLQFDYFEGLVTSSTHINKLDKIISGTCAQISVEKRLSDENFAFSFNGYIQISQDGLYTFYLRSNDGSIFYLNNMELIQNDGPHASIEKAAKTSLRKGFHKIKLDYFQMGGGKELSFQWQGPNFEKSPVPTTVFFH